MTEEILAKYGTVGPDGEKQYSDADVAAAEAELEAEIAEAKVSAGAEQEADPAKAAWERYVESHGGDREAASAALDASLAREQVKLQASSNAVRALALPRHMAHLAPITAPASASKKLARLEAIAGDESRDLADPEAFAVKANERLAAIQGYETDIGE